jgi:hypothetical protein
MWSRPLFLFNVELFVSTPRQDLLSLTDCGLLLGNLDLNQLGYINLYSRQLAKASPA